MKKRQEIAAKTLVSNVVATSPPVKEIIASIVVITVEKSLIMRSQC